MSFFKGIKSGIKKNVSFHNLVKVVGKASSFIPGVGGLTSNVVETMQSAHDAKKANRREEAKMLVDNASSQVGDYAGTQAGQFISNAGNKALDSANYQIKQGLGKAGASVADMSIKEWFKMHWLHLVIGVTALFLLFGLSARLMGKSSKSKVPYRK